MRAFLLMPEKKIAILKTGSTAEGLRRTKGDFEHWVQRALGQPDSKIVVLNTMHISSWPEPNTFRALILTGSHANVTENLSWMLSLKEYVVRGYAQSVPMLGICFGHQLLASAFGGKVGANPNGKEYGAVTFRLSREGKANPLFAGLPESFPVFMSHEQSALQLPAGAQCLGQTSKESHGAFFLQPNVWGLQFHPEFDPQIMRWYLENHFHIPAAEISRYLKDGENMPPILKRFLEILP